MRIPIQYAFSYPGRWKSSAEPVDFTKLGSLDFEEPDISVFRCLALAFRAGRTAGTMPAVMNAANEVAVAAFLGRRADYLAIERTVEAVMEAHEAAPADSLEAIEAADAWARAEATRLIGNL